MRKRIIALIISLCAFLNTAAFAEDYWTKVNTDIQTGIGTDEASGEVKKGNIDTYIKNGWSEEFFELKESSTSYVSPYQDEIDLVVKLGFMSLKEEQDFQPRENLSYYDYFNALKLLTKYSGIDLSSLENIQNIVTCETVIRDMVAILGHDSIDADKDYMSLAETAGVLDGIALNPKEAIKREEFAKVLANALDADMMAIKIGSEITYEIEEDNTILSKMNIEKIKGWVNANEDTNMYSLNSVPKGMVQIDMEEYYIRQSNAKALLGRYVTAYILNEDDEKTIIKIDVNDKKDNLKVIKSEDIDDITKTSVTYVPRNADGTLMNRTKTEKISLDGSVIYNGKFEGTVSAVNSRLLEPENGEIRIIDTDFDNVFDIIFVWDYEIYVVDQVSGTRVYCKNDKGIIDFSDDDKKVIVTMDGEDIAVSELSSWNVISLAKTKDNSMFTLLVSSESIRGVYQNTDEDEFVLVDGTRITKDITFFSDLEYNKEYKFYLTAGGKAAAAAEAAADNYTNTGTGRNYGYFRKAYLYDDNDDAASFRIFRLSDSKWVTLFGAEKVNFYSGTVAGEETDKRVTKDRITAAEAANKLDKPQLIVFETDIYGKISSITTATDLTQSGELDDSVFACNKKTENNVRTYYGGYFGGIYHQGKFMLLRVPEDREQEKYYQIEKTTVDGSIQGPMDIYDVNEAMTISGVIVRYTSATVGLSEIRGNARIIIEKIEAVELDDELVYKISSLGGKEYYVRSGENLGVQSVTKDADGVALCHIKTADGLKKGDILCADVDDLNYITAFRVDLRLSELTGIEHFTYTTGDNPARMTLDYGVVIKNPAGTNIIMNTADKTDRTKDMPRIVSGIMYSYDRKTGKFEKIDKTDIFPGDVLVTRALYYYMDVQAIVIK